MSKPTPEDVRNSPLISAADIEDRVADLVGEAIIRKIWLILLDAERLQIPVLVPIENLPLHAPSHGSLGPFLRAVCSEPTREVVGVLERPGGCTADLRGPRMAAVPCVGTHGGRTRLGRD